MEAQLSPLVTEGWSWSRIWVAMEKEKGSANRDQLPCSDGRCKFRAQKPTSGKEDSSPDEHSRAEAEVHRPTDRQKPRHTEK